MSSDNSSNSIPPISQANNNDQLVVAALAAVYRARTWLYNPDLALRRDAIAWEKVKRHPKIAHAIQKRTHAAATREWTIEAGDGEESSATAATIIRKLIEEIPHFSMARLRLARVAILGNANEWVEGRRKTKTFRLPPAKPEIDDEDQDGDEGTGADGERIKAEPKTSAELFAEGFPPKDDAKDDKPPFGKDAKSGKPKEAPRVDSPPMAWWCPTGLRHIDYRRIRLVPRWSEPGPGGESFIEEIELHLGSISDVGRYVKIDRPDMLMRLVYDDEEMRLGYGCGLLEAIYWAFWLLETIMREGLEGVERWAQGWIVGKIDQLSLGAADKTSVDVANAMMSALVSMRGRGVMIAGKGEDIEVKETTGTGHQLVSWWIEHTEDMLVQLISGALRPSGGGKGGTYGQGQVEERSVDEIIAFDRDLIDDGITRDLIGAIWRLNRPQFEQVCPGAAMPRFRSVEADHENPEAFGRVAVVALNQLRLPLVKADTYRRLGLPMPSADLGDDEIIEPGSAMPGMDIGGDPFGQNAIEGEKAGAGNRGGDVTDKPRAPSEETGAGDGE